MGEKEWVLELCYRHGMQRGLSAEEQRAYILAHSAEIMELGDDAPPED